MAESEYQRDEVLEIADRVFDEFVENCAAFDLTYEEVQPTTSKTRGPLIDLLDYVRENYDVLRDIVLVGQYGKFAWDALRYVSRKISAEADTDHQDDAAARRYLRIRYPAALESELADRHDRLYGGTVILQNEQGNYAQLRSPDIPYCHVHVYDETRCLLIEAPDVILSKATRDEFVNKDILEPLTDRGFEELRRRLRDTRAGVATALHNQ